MGWNNIEVSCGFGGGEETARFGPRQESGSSLYQIDTVACINNVDTNTFGSPNFLCHASNSQMAVAVEKNVLVFNDTFSQHICTFVADSVVDAASWSPDSQFLAFVNRQGSLSLAHIESKQVLFSKSLVDPVERSKKCFISIEFFPQGNGFHEVVVVTASGLGFRFQNIDLNGLAKAVEGRDKNAAQTIQANIKLIPFGLNEVHDEVNSAFYHKDEVGVMAFFTSLGDSVMSEWNLYEDSILLNDMIEKSDGEVGFKKVLVTPDEQYLVVLDSKKRLSLWSRFSFIYLTTWDESPVEDFKLFITNTLHSQDNGTSKSVEETKIVLLTSPDSEKKSKLVVLSLPHFHHVYSLKLSHCVGLAEMPSNQDSIIILEGVESEDDLDDSMDDHWKTSGNITTIRIRSLMEAIPQNRFSRILHKKKFDEAEEFARMFGLDLQLVHKVRSVDILDRLSPWGNEPPSTQHLYEDMIVELKACLDKIEDMEHIVNCCLTAQLPTLNATSDLLNYARQKVNFGERKFTKSSNLLQELLDGINRLVTFEVAYGSHMFSGPVWNSFLTTSLLDEVIKSFSEAKISSAIIIWRRHQSEFESKFTIPKLEQILHAIPKCAPSRKLIPWLRQDFVPFVLTIMPDGQSILADWLESTARRLEFFEKESWPDNALDLAEVMYTAFSNVSQSTQDRGVATPMQFSTKICKLSIPYFVDDIKNAEDQNETMEQVEEVNLASSMKKLGNLVKSLREVKSLHYEYNCKLSLAQFTSEDTKAIAFKLLDRIAAAELIPQTMRKYVKPYVLKNNLKLDQVLFEYVSNIVEMNAQLAAIWEPKIIAIINEIEKKQVRCDATLKLMYKASRPWTQEVEKLVMSELQKNPDNLKLNRQFQFAQLCKMLAGYGIRDSNLADLSRIEAILKHMFNTDNSSALEDALKICHYYSSLTTHYVYSMRIKFWIISGKLSECCDLLRQLPMCEVKKVVQYIVTWVDNTIMWPPFDDEDKQSQMQLTEAAVFLLSSIASRDKDFKSDALNYIRKLKNISRLQTEFGIFISITVYNLKDQSMEILRNYYRQPEKYETSNKHSKNSKKYRILRLSELLGLSIYEVEDIIVDLLKEDKNLQEIFERLRTIVESIDGSKYLHVNQQQVKLIWKMLYILLTTSGATNKFDWVKNIDQMHAFASIGLSLCDEDQLADYTTFCKLVRIISNIASQCETTDFQEDTSRSDGLLYKWIEDHYKDDSLVLPSNEIFPVIQKMFKLFIQDENPQNLTYNSCRLLGKGLSFDPEGIQKGSSGFHIVQASQLLHALVNILQENNQHQLSLVALVLGATSCGHHASTLQMGIPLILTNEKEQKEVEVGETLLKTSQVILTRAASIISEKCTQLARTVMSHRIVDNDMALCYLQSLPTQQGKDILSSLEEKYKQKFVRAQSILKIAVNYGMLRYDRQFQRQCKERGECALWGRKLQMLHVDVGSNMRYDLHQNAQAVESILQSLIKHPNIDLQSITTFCDSFGYDDELAILNYVEYQLTNTRGKALDYYQENIDKAIPMLSNISKLQSILKSNIQKKISPFDYERLTFIFKKLLEISEEESLKLICYENLQLLEMLSMYERTSEPSDWGVEENFFMAENNDDDEMMFDQQEVPDIFKKRLPFHQLTKRGKHIIAAEMTSEKNTFKLSPIIAKLNMNKDQLFAKSIQNIATKELALVKSTSKNFDFSLVENIFNHLENYILMMSVGRWLAKQLPKGPEKAKVVKRIVDRIAQILKNNTETDPNTVEELKKSYYAFVSNHRLVSTESFLIEHGVTDEKFFAMCKEPIRLIYELYYEFGDKVTFETGRLTGVPDIHALAKKIAEMNDIVLETELSKFVFKWLTYKRTLTDEDDDCPGSSMGTKANKQEILIENEKNLRRVIFTLASEYNSAVVRYLIDFDLKNSNVSSYTKMTCIRAFQVLFTLVDSQVIQKETQKDMALIYEKIVSLIYLSELEKLHVSYNEETFKKCNKEGLVKGLWRNHSHEAQGIRIIADICLDYKIFDPQLWNSLLMKLHHFNMIPYLTHALVHLSGVPALREIPSLVNMWKTVITAPFNSVSSPLTAEEEKNCLYAANLLTRCPVILDVGLEEIANLLKSNGLYTNAMYCMKLVPDRTKREKSIQLLIEEAGIEGLLSKVKQSRDQGVSDSQLDGVEEEIFNYVNENNLFVALHGTPYFERLVGHLVRSRKINNLLIKIISAGRLNDAIDLVGHYVNEHPSSATAKLIQSSDMDMRQGLLVYLQNEGLLNDVKPYITSLFTTTDASFNLSSASSDLSSPLMSSSFVK
eukprot:TCONS_00006511-protein